MVVPPFWKEAPELPLEVPAKFMLKSPNCDAPEPNVLEPVCEDPTPVPVVPAEPTLVVCDWAPPF